MVDRPYLLFYVAILALCIACTPDLPPPVAAAHARLPAELDYNFDVKPVLSDKCFACHGPDPETRMAGLRLDVSADSPLLSAEERRTRDRALNGELLTRILSDDPNLVMPPPESNLTLTPHEIAVLAKWAETGGPHRDHWAFDSPEQPDVPATDWGHNPIDAFVRARLEREDLQPSEEADAATLRRRAALVLTGLPPTDDLPNDYDALVDTLLDRPAYGEHMAAYWMDVARYADSDGYLDDKHRRLWPYRDWVIWAFNAGLPYDDFVTQQLAGDLLPEADKQTKLATTFNRLHKRNSEAGIVFEEARVEYVADRTLTLGKAFLGLSIECAQCHDHKYDPVSQRDYYATFAMFNSTAEIGTAIYGPDQTPGPALLLSSERQDSVIEFMERLIEETEGLGGGGLRDVPTLPEGEGIYVAFDRFADLDARHRRTPLRGAPESSLKVREPRVGPGRKGQALYLTEFTHLAFPEGVGWFDRQQPWTMALSLHPDTVYEDHGVVYHNEELRLGRKGYSVRLQENRLTVIMAHSWPNNAIQLRTEESLPVGEWTDVVVTYDGSSRADGFKVFLNGERADVVVDYDNLYKGLLWVPDIHTYGFNGLEMGTKSKSKIPVGLGIDEFRLYARDLTSTYDADAERELMALRGRLNDTLNAIPEIMVMGDLPEPRPTYVLDRGMYDAPTERVVPGVPETVFPWSDTLPRNRLGLARWVTHPEHPLTARVFVNRVWAMHFGRGIVETTEDFGNQGGLPSHPELLDWLARWFVASGWDVKALHRLILTSATFRQQSAIPNELLERDPDNVLLARGPSYRLAAEVIRDNALAAGGLLDRKVGGPSVYPYQPAGLWDELSDKHWRYRYPELTPENRYRRSLYTFRKRTATHPAQLIFDAPDNSVCTVRRTRSNTPLQALVLLNDPTYHEAARALVQRLREMHGDPVKQLQTGYRTLLGRNPNDAELDLLLAHYEGDGGDLTEVMHALMNTTDFYTLR